MAEPTPEERADTLAMTECPHWSEAVPFTSRIECPRCVAKEIRAAVQAEREQGWLAVLEDSASDGTAAVRAERCIYQVGMKPENHPVLLERLTTEIVQAERAAAIRALPTPEPPDPEESAADTPMHCCTADTGGRFCWVCGRDLKPTPEPPDKRSEHGD